MHSYWADIPIENVDKISLHEGKERCAILYPSKMQNLCVMGRGEHKAVFLNGGWGTAVVQNSF